jgi:hypothetical protein
VAKFEEPTAFSQTIGRWRTFPEETSWMHRSL